MNEFDAYRNLESAKDSTLDEATTSHIIGATISSPNHPMITMRGKQVFKKLKVKSATSKEHALEKAKDYYTKRGYKVHDVFHHSTQTGNQIHYSV